MTRVLHLDYETASEVDLRTSGAHVYAASPTTRILMLGWAFDDEPVRLWEPHKSAIPPAELVAGLVDPSVVCEAFNAQFERLITHYQLGFDVAYERWRCVMVKSYYLGFAGGLDTVLGQVGLRQKDPRGARLIARFCKPAPKNHKVDWYDWTNSPDDWDALGEYCVQDVEVERSLSNWLSQFPAMLEWDWHQWHIDQRINDRGVPLDVPFATRAVELWRDERERLESVLQNTAGLPKVTRGPFMQHLNALMPPAEAFESLNGDYVKSRRLGGLPAHVTSLLDLWAEKEGKAATKYNAVIKCASSDDRARGMFQYKGASRTDRVGGRRLQLQNLKRPVVKDVAKIEPFIDCIMTGDHAALDKEYGVSVSEALGGAVRHVIAAPPGKTFAIADLSSIESVLLGWLAECESINDTFKSGRDSYKVFAASYYGVPYEEVTKEMRGFSKPPVLGCGYMLGWKGLIKYAEAMGVAMEEAEARRAVDTFRGMYPEIKKFWYWIYDAIKHVVETGYPMTGYRMTIERDALFLRIRLPSGRNLSYYEPMIQEMPAPWDDTQTVMNFTYMGMNEKRQWCRIAAHAGGVTENIIQSIASDILWGGVVKAYHAGLDVILHVHDEDGIETHPERAQQDLDTLIACMTDRPSWAQDLWLGADGFITNRYTKD